MEESVSRVSELVNRLILNFFPPNTNETVINKYQAYFLRILSSKMGATVIDDENKLRMMFQKRIQHRAENENMAKHTMNSNILRLQELMQRISKHKVMNHKWSVYYLLYKLSEANDKKTDLSMSTIETIFKAKDSEKFKRLEQTQQRSRMDIENSAMNTTTQTRNTQFGRKDELQASVIKIVQKITNKGNPSIDLSEHDLLRDILFSFQGIDGNYISFSLHEDAFVIKPTISLSEPVKKMVSQLCEMGWLFKKICDFLKDQAERGLVYQSLCYGIKEELNEYYRLIAILENLRESEDDQSKSSFLVEEDSSTKSLSLRKLYLWSIEPFERLKWLGILGDACKSARGCTLLSIVHTYAKQGSPSIQVLINRILKEILNPFSTFLRQWVYKGEINDPNGEFFVSINHSTRDDSFWQEKYSVNPKLIPSFIDQQLAEKILLTGKSVNFMRKFCGVNDWRLDIEFIDIGSAVVSTFNQISKFTEFKDWVQKACDITNRKLLQVLSDKFRLSDHLLAIKRFLLFGQGDFIQYLMEILTNELSKPATSLYQHNLNSLLETAIRASNAEKINPEFLQRLEIKLLGASPGDNGWDIFSLNYRTESPLTTILTPKMMTGYLRLFNFLWRVKRVEYSLSGIWLQHMKGAQMIDKMREFRTHIHRCHILRHEMVHFLSNFFNYLMIEVIESAWKVFTDEVREAKDLNEVIVFHDNFLNRILDKALLTPPHEKIYRQLIKIFELIFRFKYTQEILFTSAQEEYQRKMNEKNRNDMLELLEEDESQSLQEEIRMDPTQNIITSETLAHLQNISKDYKEIFNEFMGLLKDDELSSKLRFLSFRLDFNEFYSNNPKNLKMKYNIEEFKHNKTIGQDSESYKQTKGDNKKKPPSGGYESFKPRDQGKMVPEEEDHFDAQPFKDQEDEQEYSNPRAILKPSQVKLNPKNDLANARKFFDKNLSQKPNVSSGDLKANFSSGDLNINLTKLINLTEKPKTNESFHISKDLSSIRGNYDNDFSKSNNDEY